MPQKCSSKPLLKKLKKLFAKIAPPTPHECFFSKSSLKKLKKLSTKFTPTMPHKCSFKQWSGRFLGIIGWEISVCKSNRLHVDILRNFYINLRYISWIPLKWSVILLKSWTSTTYFSNSTGSSVTNCRFSPIIAFKPSSLKESRKLSTKTTPIMPCKYSFERSFKILKKLKKVLHKIYSNNNHIGAPWCPHSRNSNSSQQKLLQQCLKHVPWQLFSCSCQDPQNFDIKIPLALAWQNLHQEPPCWKGKCLRDITALKPFFINF